MVCSLQVEIGAWSDGPLRFGFREDALTGLDACDEPSPPAPPGDACWLGFRLPDPAGDFADRWTSDIRNVGDFVDQTEIWELRVASGLPPSPCRLSFAQTTAPQPIRLRTLAPFASGSITVPGTIEFELPGGQSVIWLEVYSDVPVATACPTWGGIKAAYR